jgi:hypothetical protein
LPEITVVFLDSELKEEQLLDLKARNFPAQTPDVALMRKN